MQNIAEMIPEGRENAIHLNDLANACRVSNATIKKLVQRARKDGHVIISGRNGYWSTSDPAEIAAFLRSMKKSATSRFATTKALRRLQRLTPNQLELSDVSTEDNNKLE